MVKDSGIRISRSTCLRRNSTAFFSKPARMTPYLKRLRDVFVRSRFGDHLLCQRSAHFIDDDVEERNSLTGSPMKVGEQHEINPYKSKAPSQFPLFVVRPLRISSARAPRQTV